MNNEANVEAPSTIFNPPIDTEWTASRVLVVDDDDAFLNFIKRILIQVGYQVDAACDGDEGWKALNAKRYDLLITDYRMPTLSGVDLIRKLRLVSPLLPCILLSGQLPVHELDLAKLVQPGAAFEKSVSLVELFPKIRELLKASKALKYPASSEPAEALLERFT